MRGATSVDAQRDARDAGEKRVVARLTQGNAKERVVLLKELETKFASEQRGVRGSARGRLIARQQDVREDADRPRAQAEGADEERAQGLPGVESTRESALSLGYAQCPSVNRQGRQERQERGDLDLELSGSWRSWRLGGSLV